VTLNSDPTHRFICCIDMGVREGGFSHRLLRELCTMAHANGMPPVGGGGATSGGTSWTSSTAAAAAAAALCGDGTEVLKPSVRLADMALALKALPCVHTLTRSLFERLETCVSEKQLPKADLDIDALLSLLHLASNALKLVSDAVEARERPLSVHCAPDPLQWRAALDELLRRAMPLVTGIVADIQISRPKARSHCPATDRSIGAGCRYRHRRRRPGVRP